MWICCAFVQCSLSLEKNVESRVERSCPAMISAVLRYLLQQQARQSGVGNYKHSKSASTKFNLPSPSFSSMSCNLQALSIVSVIVKTIKPQALERLPFLSTAQIQPSHQHEYLTPVFARLRPSSPSPNQWFRWAWKQQALLVWTPRFSNLMISIVCTLEDQDLLAIEGSASRQ